MKMIKKAFTPWVIFLASLIAASLYLQHREEIFPVLPAQYRLNHTFPPAEIQALLSPFLDIPAKNLKYRVDNFVDRNSVKFLQKTLDQAQFEKLLEHENIPLWGWLITIEKPVLAKIRVSHQLKLIGFESQEPTKYISPATNRLSLLESLQEKTSKNLSEDNKNLSTSILNNPEIRFQKQVPNTDLVETILVNFDKNNLVRFESNLLLPVAYADVANADIQKQKSMHQFFNLFHYILISLIFLFLFRTYETHLLPWKKNLTLFFILLVAHFFTQLFTSDFHHTYLLSIFQSLMRALGSTFWMYALIVAADLVGRTFQKSKYSLSDIFTVPFFLSNRFRTSLLSGWILFIGQLSFVGLFYSFFIHNSAYVPLKIPGEHSLNCTYEFLRYFFDSLSTSVYEEVLYRLFLICLFASVFKKVWIPILISAVLWGFLHFSYQFEPFYVRGLELTLVGIAYGWVMVRYGILSVIFAHFLYNSFVLSEYEHQFASYLIGIAALSILIYTASYILGRSKEGFVFHTLEFPKLAKSNPIQPTERRNIAKRIYPLSWKYGLGILVIVIFFLFKVPMPEHDTNPLANRDKLLQISSKIISAYGQEDIWNISYNRANSEVEPLRERALTLPNNEKVLKEINFYSYLWSMRFFSKQNTKIVCDFDYARDYELVRLQCPYQKTALKLTFDEWVRKVKDPDETWTLFNIKPFDNNVTQYQYTVERSDIRSPIERKVFLTFQSNQLVHFKKQVVLLPEKANSEIAKKGMDIASIGLSIAFIALMYGFFRFLFIVIKTHSFVDKKAIAGTIITCMLYALWKVNSYKEVLIDFTNALAWKHVLFNESIMFVLKWMTLAFVSYLVFYAFIYFPIKTFKHIPSSADWNGILKRPVWKWRNTKVSLLYAFLLLSIQVLLRLLIQINSGMPELDLFHFDISYLNHEFIFITFLGLFWKNLLFWISLMIVISVLEKYLPRWAYLTGLCLVVFANVWFSSADMNSKLIELCGIYIVFYFVYNIARFDFAFYFWFILLNTVMTFLPLVIFTQYSSYLYQVIFIFIFVSMLIVYTLFQKNKILKVG